MKKTILLFLFALQLSFLYSQTQVPDSKVFRVAVFAPLYLDSIFTNSQLRNSKAIPKFVMPSLEFVQGAQIALDSLDINNHHVSAYIYDTKSLNDNITSLTRNHELDSIDLIIGSVKDKDYKQLAELAQKINAPFISGTYPNDGNITSDPSVIIVNSTLKAHIEGIHSYILENHGTDKIFLVRKRGGQEDKIASYFKMVNEQEGKPLLNIQLINLDSSISPMFFKNRIDSNSSYVIIGGSLDEDFANALTESAYAAFKKNSHVTLIGMPNWDAMRSFTRKNAFRDFPIHFTTPYYNSRSDRYFNFLNTEYTKRFKNKPTDMACKGFELAQYFVNILINYPGAFYAHLNEKNYRVFSEYNFRPVYLKKNSGTIDYYENKHLYVMRILNGTISREW